MAKVLKQGDPTVVRTYEYECHDCNSLLQFTKADVKDIEGYDDLVKCPVCNSSIPWLQVTEHIMNSPIWGMGLDFLSIKEVGND